MLLALPLLHSYLRPCPVATPALAPHPGGSYCRHCARVVHDFGPVADPAVALAAARAAAPDGRVCGSFKAEQVAGPQLQAKLRWFLVALVLVVGLGMSAQEAMAQVRGARPVAAAGQLKAVKSGPSERVYGEVVEQMPAYKAGGWAGAQRFIATHLRYPTGARWVGRVFVSFVIDEKGELRNPQVLKGLAPTCDAEVLRVVRLLKGFEPGQQNGWAVAVSFTLPVTFRRN